MAFSDEAIRAIAAEGRFTDPRAAPHLADVLIKRRNRIGTVYYREIAPLVDFTLASDGTLTFTNAAVSASVVWHRFDNAGDRTERLGDSTSVDGRVQAPVVLPSAPGAYVQLDVTVVEAPYPGWARPVIVHFRRDPAGWTLVGVDRNPSGVTLPRP
jgi:hypothetical protein